MASEIAWEFDELRAYIKRLLADDRVTGTEVAEVRGPGSGTVNAATPFRMELKFSAIAFGQALESYYAQLQSEHDKLIAVLAAAVEADATLADEAKKITELIDQVTEAKPARVTAADVGSTSAGQIG